VCKEHVTNVTEQWIPTGIWQVALESVVQQTLVFFYLLLILEF
jgi:hypothetical protein